MCTKTNITASSKDQDSGGGSQNAPEEKASTCSEIQAGDGFQGPSSSTANLCEASEVSFGATSLSPREKDPNGVISFEKILEDLGKEIQFYSFFKCKNFGIKLHDFL